MLSDNPVYSFWDHQLGLLAEQDPIEVLAATPSRLDSLLEKPRDAWVRPRSDGKWPPARILAHLRDMEVVFGFRLRTILYDDRPLLMGISQDRWNESIAVEEPPADVLADFTALRDFNLKTWRSVSGPLLERVGIHDEASAEISLDLLRRIQAGHDLSHLEQIRERLT